MDWQEIAGNWVLVPRRQTAIVHFLGGAFVARAPQVTYRLLLEHLAQQGYVIVATPFVNTFDHRAIAQEVLLQFERALVRLQDRDLLAQRYLPIYGLGHSMGCKLHLLIGSLFAVERAGNMLLSYNNAAAREAIPLLEQFSTTWSQWSGPMSVEFTPSPLETNVLISQGYRVQRNLLVQFTDDTIDQSAGLLGLLSDRFPGMVTLQKLRGNHLTPLGQDLKWQPGASFTPLDAIGQWVRQEVYRDLNHLKRTLLGWLDPFSLKSDRE
ncbi:hypothetical protein BST81_22940 [Leptolyngbya sp. 'hensonii']|uniref:DUF1350 family protein n=1 Tax=Leptolyngbya sp. 'hensonii' TaxID=1922337 RepID=UPI00094F8B34|nr:DUF1350 family protein [Leptolyngbya sp. 'hensonii']OLP16087.1 hypothetical protein BST81_22940 [Leptolyngbya sp. 'hensonii']